MQDNFEGNIFSLSNQNIFAESEKVFNMTDNDENYQPTSTTTTTNLFEPITDDQVEFQNQLEKQDQQSQMSTPISPQEKFVQQQMNQQQPRKFCFSDKPINLSFNQNSGKGQETQNSINQQTSDSTTSRNGSISYQKYDNQQQVSKGPQLSSRPSTNLNNNQYGNNQIQHHYTIPQLKANLLQLGCDNVESKQLQMYFLNLSNTNKTADIDSIIITNLQHIITLIKNQYGNYLMSVLIQVCSESCLTQIFEKVQDQLLELARYQFSSKAAQYIVRRCNQEQTLIVYRQLQQNFMLHSTDKYSCHTVQEILQKLEVIDYCDYIDFVVDNVQIIAENQFGSRIVEILLQQVNRENEQYFQPLITALSNRAGQLSKNPYGNYLIIKLLKIGTDDTKKLVQIIIKNLLQLSTDKYGSNVVEQLIHIADKNELQEIENIILTYKNWVTLIQESDYGHYSVQKLLSRIEESNDQRKIQDVCETCRRFGGGNKWVEQQLDKMEDGLQRL